MQPGTGKNRVSDENFEMLLTQELGLSPHLKSLVTEEKRRSSNPMPPKALVDAEERKDIISEILHDEFEKD